MMHEAVVSTPLGNFLIKAGKSGLIYAAFTKREKTSHHPRFIGRVQDQIEGYFAKERKDFRLPIDWSELNITDFSMEVYRLLLRIPYGKTRSYQDIAEYLGRPRAARAIGRIVSANPVALIIPCHRILSSDGHLSGYAYGLEKKRRLLLHEGPLSKGRQISLFSSEFQELPV